MKNVLIIGGESFTGKYLCKLLKEHNYHVITTSKDDSSYPTMYKYDLLSGEGRDHLLESADPDIILILAAISDTTYTNLDQLYKINLYEPLKYLQELDKKAKRPKKHKTP